MKKNLTLLAMAVLAVAGAMLTGCKTKPVGEIVMDSRVRASVSSESIQDRRTPGDNRLEVMVLIHNREDRRLQVQINCAFRDERGLPSEGDEAPYQTLILTENSDQPVRFISMNDKAKSYTIRIREAH